MISEAVAAEVDVGVRARAVSSVVAVGEGAPVAGTPARARGRAGGAQTLATPGRRGRRGSVGGGGAS